MPQVTAVMNDHCLTIFDKGDGTPENPGRMIVIPFRASANYDVYITFSPSMSEDIIVDLDVSRVVEVLPPAGVISVSDWDEKDGMS